MFIGFGAIITFKSGNYYYLKDSPVAYLMAALIFGLVIILITYDGVLHNLIPNTIGNILGDAIFMGVLYYYLNNPFLNDKKQSS